MSIFKQKLVQAFALLLCITSDIALADSPTDPDNANCVFACMLITCSHRS